jgi:hypothetical protein
MRRSSAAIFASLVCTSVSVEGASAREAEPMPAVSSELATTSQTNPNLQDFDFVVEKLRRNYAGWDTKVTDETRPALDRLTARLRSAAKDASPEELTAILREWTGFFEDGHVGVVSVAAASALPPSPASTPTLAWTEASVRAELATRGASRDPLEGIWQIDGDRYRFGILPTPGKPGSFAAVVLTTTSDNWAPGQVKAELTRTADGGLDVLYRTGNHAENRTHGTLLLDGAVAAHS